MTLSRLRVAAVLVLAAVALTACGPVQHVVEGSVVTVVTDQPFTSANPATAYGNTQANRSIAYATQARFNFYNPDYELQRDDSFGSYQLVSSDPLTVKYTIANGVEWSDGERVDAADLLLAWAANSGVFTSEGFEPGDYVDRTTGRFSDEYPTDVVYFDGAPSAGLGRVTQVPEVSDDGRAITLVYDEYFVDWELAFQVGVPAHVVGMDAVRADDPAAAKEAVLSAIQSNDTADLARISRSWNNAFNFDELPRNADLLVGTGPYTVTAIEPGESVTLTANPRYRGRHQPSVETVKVVTLADPLAAASALADGTADIATPFATPDVLREFTGLDDVTVDAGIDGTWEHLDLQFEHGRSDVFEDPLVREAFLKMVPRQEILDELVAPLLEDAELLDSLVLLHGTSGYDAAVASNGSEDYQRLDVSGARALLREADVTDPTVCILFDPANPRRVAEFQLIKESAAGVGFQVTNCSQPSWTEILGLSGAYDAALFGWNTTNLAVSSAEARLRSDSTISNLNHFADPEVDDLLDRLAASRDSGEQQALLAEVDALLWDRSYGLPLYQFPVVTAHSDRVSGISPSPLEPGLVWNLWEWQPSADSD